MPGHFVIFGPAQPGFYSQAFISANFHLALNLTGETQEVNLDLGHRVVHDIEETIRQSPQASPNEVLTIVETLIQDTGFEVKLNLVIAKIEANFLTLAATGETSAKLIRADKIINLLSKAQTVSGPINPGDTLVLGTQAFFTDLFTPDILKAHDDLVLKLESLENNSSIAALVVQVENIENSTPQVLETKPPPKNLFLRHRETMAFLHSPSKRVLYAALIVLVFLISLIAFQLRGRNLEQRTRSAIAIEKQVNDGLDSAKKLAGLNDIIARDILTQTKKDFVAKANESFGTNWPPRLKPVLDNLDSNLALVSHVYTLSTLDTFSDFNLLKANTNVTAATLNTNQIAAIDGNNGAVYTLGTKGKAAAIAGGLEDFKKESYVDFVKEEFFVFSPSGIFKNNKLLIKPSEKWAKIRGLKIFAGNIYLLDTAASQIWKYQRTDFGFADISPYLKAGGVDFTYVTSFAVDGSIYVLSSSGNIVRFTGGLSEEFKTIGLEVPFKNPTSIFTSDETKNIYVLDSGNSRLVILDKSGNYVAQYVLPKIDTNLILADESVKKVFLLSGSKVYSFDLK